jgi:hypothetical protein
MKPLNVQMCYYNRGHGETAKNVELNVKFLLSPLKIAAFVDCRAAAAF